MEVDLLLKHDKLFVHLNLQVVSSSLNLSFQLDHFFFLQKHKWRLNAKAVTYLLFEELLSLILLILLLQSFDPLAFLHLEGIKLFSVVHSFINALVNSYQFLVVLHDFEAGIWLDFCNLNCSVKFVVKNAHLLFVLNLKILNFVERFFFILFKWLFPTAVKVLQMLLSDLNVLSHLAALNVGAQLILESYNLALKEPDFFH